MAIYSIAQRTSNTTTANASVEIIASASNGPKILEMGVMINAATQCVLGVGVPATKGVTPGGLATVLAEDGGNSTTGLTTSGLTWGTGPVAPANYYRRMNLNAAVGAGAILTFPRAITILKTTTLVLYNLATNPVYDYWVVVDE